MLRSTAVIYIVWPRGRVQTPDDLGGGGGAAPGGQPAAQLLPVLLDHQVAVGIYHVAGDKGGPVLAEVRRSMNPSPDMRRGQRLVPPLCIAGVLLVAGADGVTSTATDAGDSYVKAVLAPRLKGQLETFLAAPTVNAELSHAALGMGVIAPTEESLLPWMYTQIKEAEANADDDSKAGIRMIYAGLEDGAFFGYYNTTELTRRAGGDATAADYDWFPYGEGCGDSIFERANAATLDQKIEGTYLCSMDDSNTWQVDASCNTTDEDFQDAVEEGWCDASDAANSKCCCHRNIRTFYSTRPSLKGRANEVTGWKVYDPRVRAWYTSANNSFHAKSTPSRTCDGRCDSTSTCEENQRCGSADSNDACAGNDDTADSCDAVSGDCSLNVQDVPQATSGWSPIYLFSTNKVNGITKTSIMLDRNGEFAGVYAVDVTLDRLSSLLEGLKKTLGSSTNVNAPWAYIVERSGDNAGLLVASSDGDITTGSGDSTTRVLAIDSDSPRVRTSAAQLSESSWPETNGDDNEMNIVWVSTQITFSGLDWLLVVGQDTACSSGDWTPSSGTCQPCGEAQVPIDGGCELCKGVFNGSEPNVARSSCVLPSGRRLHLLPSYRKLHRQRQRDVLSSQRFVVSHRRSSKHGGSPHRLPVL
jgi:hypothetical protein